MSPRLTGWLFVAAQAALLGALIIMPSGDGWPTPSWLRAVGYACIVAGLALVAVAALGLGSALTPTPVPRAAGQLATSGLYRHMRHPIYSGVLIIVFGLTVRSGNWAGLAVAVITVVFFDRKARWEERWLAERYDGYRAYAATTPRFLPRPGGRLTVE